MDIPPVMTAVDQDRPGLIEAVARFARCHSCNWLESWMCRCGGELEGVFRVNVRAENKKLLIESPGTLRSEGFILVLEPEFAGPKKMGNEVTPMLRGWDSPEIVREVTDVIARHRMNIEELETECSSAPMSSEMLFFCERAPVYSIELRCCQTTVRFGADRGRSAGRG